MASTQEESVLRTRGGGGGDLGDADTGLSETDPEVWEIITAERRRQVGGVILTYSRQSREKAKSLIGRDFRACSSFDLSTETSSDTAVV